MAGWDDLARSVRGARHELQLAVALKDTLSALASGSRSGLAAKDQIEEGLAAGTIPTVPGPEAVTVLPQRLQTALAVAFATGTKRNQVAQLKRAQTFLTRALGQKRLDDEGREELANALTSVNAQLEALTRPATAKTGAEPPIVPLKLEDRLARAALQGVKQQVAALRQVEAFLVQQIRVEKDINRRIQERTRLRETRSDIARLTAADPLDLTAGRSRFGTIGQGPVLTSPEFQFAQQFGFKARPKDLLADLRAQVNQGAQFGNALARLKKRGAPEALLTELGQGDFATAKTLSTAPKTLLNQFFKTFNRRENLVREQAARLDVQHATITIGNASITGLGGGKPGKRGTALAAKFFETAAAARHF